MPGFITLNRDPIDAISDTMKTKIPGTVRTVLICLLWHMKWEPGSYKGMPLESGDVCISISGISKWTGIGIKPVRNAVEILIKSKCIVQKGANEGASGALVYRVENRDIYVNNFPQGAIQWARKGQARGNVQRSKEVNLKDLTPTEPGVSDPGNSPAGGNGKAGDGEKADPVKTRRKAPPYPGPTPPHTNAATFLNRAVADDHVVVNWGKDGKLVKGILAQRLASGVQDPQDEMWGLWKRFLAAEADEAFTMRGRAHDIPAFINHYNLLLEKSSTRAGGNGSAPPMAYYESDWAKAQRAQDGGKSDG